jgi:hypothetical protein
MRISAAITTVNDSAFRRKAMATPKRAMRSPATTGPTMRAVLNAAEFSATALTMSSLPTSSATKDCRVGMSSVFTQPRMVASTHTCQYSTWPKRTSSPRVRASEAMPIWVARSTRRLGSRSARAPVNTENRSTGANWSVPIRPSLSGEPVSWRTSQAWPTDCIHEPTCETTWPM